MEDNDFIIREIVEADKTEFPYSRYRKDRKLRMESGVVANETVRKRFIREIDDDLYHKVTPAEENRIDLIAFKYYNDVRLWWVIAVANDLEDPMILEPDQVLRIPSTVALYGRGGVLA